MRIRNLLWQTALALVWVLLSVVPGYASMSLENVGYSQAPFIQGGTFNNLPPQNFSLVGLNGVSVMGDFGFTANGGPVTFSYSVDLWINPLAWNVGLMVPGNQTLGGAIDGRFFTDETGHTIALTGYSAETFFTGYSFDNPPGTFPVLGDFTIAAPAAGAPVPLPTSPSLHELTSGSSGPFYLDSSTLGLGSDPNNWMDLRQVLTVTFSGLQSGDVVHVDFPNQASFNPGFVPEPSSLTLIGTFAVGGLIVWALRKTRRAGLVVKVGSVDAAEEALGTLKKLQ